MWGVSPHTPHVFAHPPTLFAAASRNDVPKDAMPRLLLSLALLSESLGILYTKDETPFRVGMRGGWGGVGGWGFWAVPLRGGMPKDAPPARAAGGGIAPSKHTLFIAKQRSPPARMGKQPPPPAGWLPCGKQRGMVGGMMTYVWFLLGLVALFLGGDVLVRCAARLAAYLGVPPLIVGMSIVALGTSAPEFFTSLTAALTERDGIAIGNVVGSNVANVLLVLGLPALFCAIPCGRRMSQANGAIMMGVTLVFVGLCLYGAVARWMGLLLLVGLAALLVYWFQSARYGRMETQEVGEVPDSLTLLQFMRGRDVFTFSVGIFIGLLSLVTGADLLVRHGSDIARAWGVSEEIIAVSLIALGTSLPEVAATGAAAWRRHTELALGNVLGSNMFNILFVLGGVAAIAPLEVSAHFLRLDVWVMLGAAAALMPFLLLGRDIGWKTGCVFLWCYTGYIGTLVVFERVPGL